jgi:hypothetical protein
LEIPYLLCILDQQSFKLILLHIGVLGKYFFFTRIDILCVNSFFLFTRYSFLSENFNSISCRVVAFDFSSVCKKPEDYDN